jgi:LmbE family N-acetylglucosaminyl deacetylase
MNIVAHQDDDLLFINPDTLNDIKEGHCVRTVYVTAGNAGAGSYYWLGREQGSEAAYAYMLGVSDSWVQKIVEINSHEFISIANPKGNTKVSLVFMRLPDGNLKGQGFPSSNFESLAKLEAGQINTLNSVDGQSYYSQSQLTSALEQIMLTYQPTVIRTQADYVSSQYPDHSDHIAVGQEVKKAYDKYESEQYGNLVTIPIKYYIGYPIHAMPNNVSGNTLIQKELTFLAYAKYDSQVCQTMQQCTTSTAYSHYLPKEYTYSD